MTKQEAIEFFGTQAVVAEVCGIEQPSVANWGVFPPPIRQVQLETASRSSRWRKRAAEFGHTLKAETDVLHPKPKHAAAG